MVDFSILFGISSPAMPNSLGRLLSLMAMAASVSLVMAQTSPPAATSQSPVQAAVQTLASQYYAAYAKKDLTVITGLWNSKSPDLASQQKAIEQFFTANEKIEIVNLTFEPLMLTRDHAHLRVGFELRATDVKTGKPAESAGKAVRNFECVEEAGTWKVWHENDAFDDLAGSLIDEPESDRRKALMEQKKDLVTPLLEDALQKRGDVFRSQGEMDKSRNCFLLMQGVAHQINDSNRLSTALRNLAYLSDMQGDHRQALAYLDENLEVARALGNRTLIAISLMNLGNVRGQLGDYSGALSNYNESMKSAQSLDNKEMIASLLNNIGEVNLRQGNHEEALQYYQKALAIDETEKHEQRDIAVDLDNIGIAFQNQGNYARALDSFSKSLTILNQVEDADLRATVLNSVGDLYISQGDYSQAMDYYSRSLPLREKVGDKDGIAETLKAIGVTEEMQGSYSEAMQHFQKSLALSEETGQKLESFYTLNYVGEVQAVQGHYADALATHQKGLAEAEAAGVQSAIVQHCINLARLHIRQREFKDALQFAQRATTIAQQTGNREAYWQASSEVGSAYVGMDQPADARRAFDDAIAKIEELRSDVAGGEEQQHVFLEQKLAPYERMVELLVAQNDFGGALTYAERAKGRALLDVLASGHVNVAKAMSAAELERERELQDELVSLNRQIGVETAAAKPNQTQLADLRTHLDKTRLQYADYQSSLYAAHPELKRQRGQVQTVTLADAERLLPDSRSAILEFVVTENTTYLFVVTRQEAAGGGVAQLKAHILDVRAKDLEQETEKFRQQLARRDLQFHASAASLAKLLLQPAQSELKGKNTLIIVPDGPLWNLPFQALVEDNNHYLLEDYAVAYAPSLTVLREMMHVRRSRRPDSLKSQPSVLLAMADPVLAEQTAVAAAFTYRGEKPASLPDARIEAAALKQLYGDKYSAIYVGDGASEDVFKAEANKFDVLHLATHGVFDDASPMYSHVMLSPGKSSSKDDGLLEAWEIMQMDLKADLAVLSACETGRGRVSAGEGLIGLSWAFFVAGVPTTVVSQWKVESRSTTQLMTAFHRERKANLGRAPSSFATTRALRQAELQLLHSGQYAHPFYWASFVVVGDPN